MLYTVKSKKKKKKNREKLKRIFIFIFSPLFLIIYYAMTKTSSKCSGIDSKNNILRYLIKSFKQTTMLLSDFNIGNFSCFIQEAKRINGICNYH